MRFTLFERSLHIERLEPNNYAITYYPRGGSEVALGPLKVNGEAELLRWLSEIEIAEPDRQEALTALQQKGKTIIPDVNLTEAQVKRCGL